MADRLTKVFSEKTDTIHVIGKAPDDRLKLFIDVFRTPETPPISRKDILELLERHVKTTEVHLGVIDDIVKRLNEGIEFVEERRILVGRKATPGANGKLLFLKKQFDGKVEVATDKTGIADFTQLHLFDNVEPGDIVARHYPPKAGTDGVDVFGKKIPAEPGKAYPLLMDETLSLKELPGDATNYQIVVSQKSGYVCEERGRLCIKPELCVDGDLDFRFGSIDFIGSVSVSGDVLPGFHIKAKTGITVHGSVRGGSLICADGDVIVEGHIYGGHRSRIICGRTLFAKIAQEVRADIVGDICIAKESRGSLLRTQGILRMPKGSLVGGEVYTASGVEANVIGSSALAETKIYLCSDVEATRRYSEITVAIENHERAAALLALHLGPYAEAPKRLARLSGTFRDKMYKFKHKLDEVEQSKARLIARKEKMMKSAKSNASLRVNVSTRYHEGAVITAGSAQFGPMEALEGPASIRYTGNGDELRFQTGELEPFDEPTPNTRQTI